jgi:hypothetical protein
VPIVEERRHPPYGSEEQSTWMEADEVTAPECSPEMFDVACSVETGVPRPKRRVEGTRRHANKEIGLDACFSECPQHTHLVPAERPASGQHKGEWSGKCA